MTAASPWMSKREDLFSLRGVLHDALAGAGFALDHRVDELQVARVRRQLDIDRAALAEVPVGLEAEVVLHVAVALGVLGHVVLGELGEEGLQRLLQEVRQHVEPPAVGHAQDDLQRAVAPGARQNGFQRHHHALAAFQGKPLLADVAGMQEPLEHLGVQQGLQHPALRGRLGGGLLGANLQTVAQPVPGFDGGQVHELRPDVPGVGALQAGDHLPQAQGLAPEERAVGDRPLQVGFREAELAEGQQRLLRPGRAQRVQLGQGVPERAVGVDQRVHALLEGNGLLDRRRRSAAAGIRPGPVPPGGRRQLRGAEFETLEEGRPGTVHGAGVALPVDVEFL